MTLQTEAPTLTSLASASYYSPAMAPGQAGSLRVELAGHLTGLP